MDRIPYPVELKPAAKRSLWIRFEDGTSGTVDLSHLDGLGIFKRWDTTIPFSSAFIVPDRYHVIGWDDELELDADALYLELIGKTFDQWKEEQEAAYAHH